MGVPSRPFPVLHRLEVTKLKKLARWLIAIIATISAFAVGLYGAGSLFLPLYIKSGGDRWVIAAGLGVAFAALAALWGINFVEGTDNEVVDEKADGSYPGSITLRAKASEKARIYQAGRDQHFKDR
jgi:hypothetical protein